MRKRADRVLDVRRFEFQRNRERLRAGVADRFFRLKNRRMRFAHFRMNRPAGLAAIDHRRRWETVLGEIARRLRPFHRRGGKRGLWIVARGDAPINGRDHKISIWRAPGTVGSQRRIGQRFQAHAGDPRQHRMRRERVDLLRIVFAARQQRAIRKLRESRAALRFEIDRVQHNPIAFRRDLRFPFCLSRIQFRSLRVDIFFEFRAFRREFLALFF